MNSKGVREYLWKKLGLSGRSVIFSVFEVNGDVYFSDGLITDPEDMWDSDEFHDVAIAICDEPDVTVDSVQSYMIGDGESDRADYKDLDVLRKLMDEDPVALSEFMLDFADELSSLSDITVDNIYYEEEGDYKDDGI